MLHHAFILAIVGMFYTLANLEDFPRIIDSEENLSCSCKKKRKSSLKIDEILSCEGHDEPLEEEKWS